MSQALVRRVAQWTETSSIVELFELDLTPIEPQLDAAIRVQRFAPEANEKGQDILWGGVRYRAIAMAFDGFKLSGRGALPRPHLRITNLGGLMGMLCLAYKDLVGARLIRRRTLAHFLPADNFVGGNVAANDAARFPDDVFFIRRKVLETPEHVEFELALVYDLEGVKLPRRQIIADTCGWTYGSAECEWDRSGGGPYFNENDDPTSAAGDQCSFTLRGCRKRFHARFGRNAWLPFGGFPAARMTRGD